MKKTIDLTTPVHTYTVMMSEVRGYYIDVAASTPEQAMEAPMSIPAGSQGHETTTRKSPLFSTFVMVPMAVTIPVNMRAPG